MKKFSNIESVALPSNTTTNKGENNLMKKVYLILDGLSNFKTKYSFLVISLPPFQEVLNISLLLDLIQF